MAALVAGAFFAALGLARALGVTMRTAGATFEEVRGRLPGDARSPDHAIVTTRAVTIDAPPSQVWPWLVQLGWGRGGWYAIDAVERLVGAARTVHDDGRVDWRSSRVVIERHQQLAVGDLLPLGPRAGFEVVELEPERHLVVRFGRGVEMVWTLTLVPLDGGARTRLLARTRFAAHGPARALVQTLLDPGHAVMEWAQLQGVRRRAEQRDD